ncbi:MAG: ferrous iron transport protein B [Candidatus Electrothrix aestuarii]|uniref:Ferrous iron transport protein B n=1 Tax=Candidatus Electrothrix aestuarii TaxID=3062594 RepID=A0AAU8LZX3_9BACT|nr:ferrous iron transport protein B [Candidatus Electrothrix aestuarii]
MADALHIALAGNPNAGKTTLFNFLTGARQHVGNYPGVTVEKKEGKYSHEGKTIRIVDLPGTYSLTAYSVEELVARDYLVNEQPDVVVNVVDASNLERNLYLSCQFLELGVPLVIALNMIDVAEKRGIRIDTEKLSELTGVPVVPLVARNGKGVPELLQTVQTVSQAGPVPRTLIRYGADIDEAIRGLVPIIEEHELLTATYPASWTALKVLENDEQIVAKIMLADMNVGQQVIDRSEALARHLQDTIEAYPETVIADHRYGFIRSILRQGKVTRVTEQDRLYASDQIDKVVTNRVAGPLLMAAVLFGLYSFTFNWSGLLVDWFAMFFEMLGNLTETMLPDGPVKSMIISGVIDGVGGVLGFVPIIMFMFLGIAVLEDSGYLARVAFMMDRIFHFFGLHGSSVMPFIISGGIAGGCAVPGVLAARTLRSPKERMATLLTVPFMNCGAKLPVLTLIVAAFFPAHQARYMFLATLVSWLVALMAAKFLRMTLLRGESTPFVMELPPYRLPTAKGLLIHTWERTWQYMKKAGTVILGISILLWAMMTYPGLPEDKLAEFETMRQQAVSSGAEEDALLRIDSLEAEAGLRHSLAGRIGMALEPVTHFAGFDWRTNIALVGGFAAKEVIVSTLGTAYSLGEVDPENTTSLKDRLARDKHWNPVAALAFLFFIMFYSPCFVTVVAIAKEAGSWKWAFFSMGFNTVFAFSMAVGIFQLGSLLGLR